MPGPCLPIDALWMELQELGSECVMFGIGEGAVGVPAVGKVDCIGVPILVVQLDFAGGKERTVQAWWKGGMMSHLVLQRKRVGERKREKGQTPLRGLSHSSG